MGLITSYAALGSTQADDLLPVVDVHDTSMSPSGTTKKITVATLLAGASSTLLTRVAVQAANYTAAANQIVPVDTTSGNVTVTLPAAPAAGTLMCVKQVTLGGTNTVSVTCAGSDVFNKAGGAVTGTLTLLAQGMLLHYNGAGIWTVLADDLPLTQLDSRYVQQTTWTTLGDILYGAPAPTRLPGSTSATKQFLTQAGNGTISAAPAWGTIAAADLPQLTNYAPSGLTGATSASRYAGATASGAPVSGTFAVGDWVADRTGKIWMCTSAGTPGTWTQIGAGGSANYGGIFGDGSDGSVTFDGAATILGLVPASNIYTMTRDIWCTGITINSGVTLKTQNFRVFCAGTLTNNGTISNTGGTGNANGNAGGSAGSTTGIFGGLAGGAGNVAAGTIGVGGGGSYGVAQGGAGGTGSGGAGGGAGSIASTSTAYLRAPHSLVVGSLANSRMNGGSGGGGGGGDATNKGGGGGGGGGIVGILAWAVNNGGGTISAAGGPGGTPATGNCGGGGGGGGGLILVFTLSAWTAGTTAVTGGALGNGVGTGTNGVAGGNGSVLNVVVQ